MWILPPSKEEKAAQEKQMLAQLEHSRREWERKAKAKAEWLAANTCKHCGQHPIIPPWFL